MKRTPAPVIPLPLDRPRKSHGGHPDQPSRLSPLGPIRALVVDAAAAARRRVCRAGRRVAGDECLWFEAADADTASRTLASSGIDLIVADSHSIRHSLQGWTDGATARPGQPAPLIVVISDGEPQRIQQMLDAGAECCLPKHLPEHILEIELRRLVVQTRRKARRS